MLKSEFEAENKGISQDNGQLLDQSYIEMKLLTQEMELHEKNSQELIAPPQNSMSSIKDAINDTDESSKDHSYPSWDLKATLRKIHLA